MKIPALIVAAILTVTGFAANAEPVNTEDHIGVIGSMYKEFIVCDYAENIQTLMNVMHDKFEFAMQVEGHLKVDCTVVSRHVPGVMVLKTFINLSAIDGNNDQVEAWIGEIITKNGTEAAWVLVWPTIARTLIGRTS